MPSSDPIAQVIGSIPSGCAVLTARSGSQSTGILASWIQQASFQPILLSVAIKQHRPIEQLIKTSGRLLLNIINGDPKPIFKHFAQGFAPDQPAFTGLETDESDYGVILNKCLGYVGGRVVNQIVTGDHHLYIVQPETARIIMGGEAYVHTRKSASNY
ncbi:MAG: putative diflavin flavoprotein A 5 [Phycisphaerae bacterium]|nr:putative diflavin flavoprotein A 5 [Phycisphaerae bacterium]